MNIRLVPRLSRRRTDDAPVGSKCGVIVSVGIAPPAIPVYAQPICPGDGYIWTPGYWRWKVKAMYGLMDAWVLSPYVGALWTPGYWGWGGGCYLLARWLLGPHGRLLWRHQLRFGYFGTGFYGGYWGGATSSTTALWPLRPGLSWRIL